VLEVEALVAGWAQPAIQPISFCLERGEILALTGPNGAGKSTLLAALAGSGRIFSGQCRREPGARLGFQTQGMPPIAGLPLSGAELLALTGATPDGLPPWLSGCLNQRLDRLSGGQRQYLALWSVLRAPAELLFLDEPANHLDRAGIEHLEPALRQRAKEGAGILLVSHDPQLLRRCCDRTIAVEPLL
jgi:ATPase subunit of ABC transporter with duplicated ATPase domains